MVSTEVVAAAMGAGKYAQALEEACIRFGIVTALEKSHFLAHMAVESQGFTRVRENLGYSAQRLLEVFPGRNGLKTLAQAKVIVAGGRDAIAEAIYGGAWGAKNLGNTQPGDGARFPGLSLIHLTGRANVTAYSQAMYGDDRVVREPGLLEKLPDAVLAAGWYWIWRGCGEPARRDDLEGSTRKVNGGLNGLADRAIKLAQAKKLFGIA
ncbi:putative chitinase [Stenotrophomonas rhizophila]|uniref:Putative chitinase n=1 Tax=Stenotrophomonas rhizophila TaxID=216778 RepID=A0A498CGP7_9GAMM|nr:glycoside hydrolase family 19 protein [Stenotrophomonas rhizophila]RLK53436.1 putative chitinase [Stenotrophomonas rhizophila]